MAMWETSSKKPTRVLVDLETKQLQIDWADKHQSTYDLSFLRRACPCIQCQPWKEGMGEVGNIPESVLKAVGELKSMSDVTMVGGYALQFYWADGHSYGIYDFGYLRAMCPCSECHADWERRAAELS
jgi:DUF971 family protein